MNISWDDFRLVKAISDTRSLVGAAEILGLNHSTVFRRLGALEKSLAIRLFERSRNGYAPTPAGDEMVALARRMSEEIVDFERGVAGRDTRPSGQLRVTTNDTFIMHLLAPVFGSFRKAYPDILLDVIVTHQALNLSRRDADIAIRATLEPPETLVGRRIARFVWSRYIADDYEELAGKGRRTVVGFGEALNGLRARKWLESNEPDAVVAGRFDTLLGVSQAVAAGLGMSVLPCFVGDNIAGIRRVGEPIEFGDSLWLLTHSDLRNAARVRAFLDHAAQELVKLRPLIEGRGPSARNAGADAGKGAGKDAGKTRTS